MVRHHLIERMLSEMFGMAWYEIHDEVERLEHAVSPAFEKIPVHPRAPIGRSRCFTSYSVFESKWNEQKLSSIESQQ
ncbi:MAG TPA: iron dependent repressor, metal binding and dimerization domain protein [Candidatus Dormibacteraeota bacterium]|nr:iron dependent repressor, metal binding and dimerization domain protein [Candidatus Dormibacteraeota bacterium]